MSSGKEDKKKRKQRFTIQKFRELRVEVPSTGDVSVTLIQGDAEIFGTPLEQNKPCFIRRGRKVAIFSWESAQVDLEGVFEDSNFYIADETPMETYLEVHHLLESRRSPLKPGPRIMVIGPPDSGKSTLSRILASYACRESRNMTFIDLDVGRGHICVPGSISAVSLEGPVNIEHEFSLEAPLTYFYGHYSVKSTPEWYKKCVENLAAAVELRLEKHGEAREAGFVVNTARTIKEIGQDVLMHVVDTFRPNVVLVLADDRLHSQLSRKLQSGGVVVKKVPKSGGVFSSDSESRTEIRRRQFAEYFYGAGRNLNPSSITLNADDIFVCEIGGPKAPDSCLPIGSSSTIDPLKSRRVPFSELEGCVLGVLHCNSLDQILTSNIAGIVYVQRVDRERNTLTVLAPTSQDIPSKYFVSGSIRLSDV